MGKSKQALPQEVLGGRKGIEEDIGGGERGK